jgi:2-amino-4-hydroxy-6-hydroxymethyldihydropteridine diphosphokinase
MARALQALRERTTVLCTSSIWHSPALGTDGPDFLNATVKIATTLDSLKLKSTLLSEIEQELGRRRVADKFAPRTIDLDVLIFDGEVYDEHIWDYAYLAVPLAECAPELRQPATGLSIESIASELKRRDEIRKV